MWDIFSFPNAMKTKPVKLIIKRIQHLWALKIMVVLRSQVKWGEHLVMSMGCGDCHTPKKMGPMGPEDDSTLLLSGHPAKMPPPDVDRKAMESKGLIITNDRTAWVGPWGISYTANLTSDETGIGTWSEDQFLYAIRNGKQKGFAGSRMLLPPMPWQTFRNLTGDELKAMFLLI